MEHYFIPILAVMSVVGLVLGIIHRVADARDIEMLLLSGKHVSKGGLIGGRRWKVYRWKQQHEQPRDSGTTGENSLKQLVSLDHAILDTVSTLVLRKSVELAA